MKKYILLSALCIFVLVGCESVDLKEKKERDEQRKQQEEIRQQIEEFNAVKPPKSLDEETSDQPVAGPALPPEGEQSETKNNETTDMAE